MPLVPVVAYFVVVRLSIEYDRPAGWSVLLFPAPLMHVTGDANCLFVCRQREAASLRALLGHALARSVLYNTDATTIV